MISTTDPLSLLVQNYVQAAAASGVSASTTTTTGTGALSGIATLNAANVQAQISAAGVRAQANQARQQRYAQVGASLDALSATALGLQAPGATVAEAATTSNASVVTAQPSDAAMPGSYTIVVNALATSQANLSASFANKDAAGSLGSGQLQFTPAGGSQVSLTIDGTTSLTSLAAAINAANGGVQALVQTNGDGSYSLNLQGTATGAANSISYNETGSVALHLAANQTRAAANAAFTVDGSSRSSPTNTVNSVAVGLTVQLVGASTQSATVSVFTDSSQVAGAAATLVSSFNAAVTALNTARATVVGSGISADNILDTLGEQLNAAAGNTYASGGAVYNTLASIGILQQRDGTLTLDAGTLQSAIAADPNSVAGLLGGSTQSVAATFGQLARDWGGDGGGSLLQAGFAGTLDQQRADPVGADGSSTAAYALSAYQAMQTSAATQQQESLAQTALMGLLL